MKAVAGLVACLLLGAMTHAARAEDSELQAPIERVATVGGAIRDWAEKGNTLYVAQGDFVRVFERTDRNKPKLVAEVKLTYPGVAMQLAGDKLWVHEIGYNVPRYEKATICLDVSDPTHPRELKFEEVPGEVGEVLHDDSPRDGKAPMEVPFAEATGVVAGAERAWVSDNEERWTMLDVRDPARPVVLGRSGLPNGDRPLAMIGTLVYGVGKKPGLRVYDGDKPGTCALRASVELGAPVENLSFVDKIVYAALGEGGLATIDIADPARPKLIGKYPTKYACESVQAQGKLAVIQADDLFLLDVSDPARPKQIKKLWVSDMLTTEPTTVDEPFSETGSVEGWTLCGQSLVIQWSRGEEGRVQEIYDVRDPAQPRSIESSDGDYYDGPRSAIASGTWLIAEYYTRNTQRSQIYLKFWDVKDSAHPKYLGEHARFDSIADHAAWGNDLYVADGVNGLQVFKMKRK